VDDIGLLLSDVPRGTPLELADGTAPAVEDIAAGHKSLARHSERRSGPQVREVIGVALADIPAAARPRATTWASAVGGAGIESVADAPPAPPAPPPDHFLGYRRADGRAATRNYIVVVPTVNCSATVARMIALRADDRHKGTPGLDGVIALPHDLGCGMAEGTPGRHPCGALCGVTSAMPTSRRPS